jgi:hypothetical protein
MCTLKILVATVKKIDSYRKHCLWRGNDINSKKPALAAWSMITQTKKNGGLGVVRLETHNKALLLKFLHKFFNNHYIPWVNLVWNNYYRTDRLPNCSKIGSFWWKSLLSLVKDYRGLAAPTIGDGRTILFWGDMWNRGTPAHQYPELFSFACNSKLTVKEANQKEHLIEIFQLPLSVQAYDQFLELDESWGQITVTNTKDAWKLIWGADNFSTKKTYRHLMGQAQVHQIFRSLWKNKCQPKHKVFFWLWLKNRLNTRDMLRRKNMTLESYTCENCIWQKEETLYHLFLKCNFAKACWNSIGLMPPRITNPADAAANLKQQLNVPFSMEIVILMTWSIWKCRNAWLFQDKDPTVQQCKNEFTKELHLVTHRAKGRFDSTIPEWLQHWQ